MSGKDKLLEDIKKGKGLPPLNSQSSGNSAGLTTEQRSDESGMRYDRNSLNQNGNLRGNRRP